MAGLQAAAAELQAAGTACAGSLIEWVDGPLVEAMKQGDVLLIDELNLAEDAVLERLNRCTASPTRLPCMQRPVGRDGHHAHKLM